jgi:two-component system response regulator LytT
MTLNRKYRSLIVEDNPLIVDQLVSLMEQTGLFETPYIALNCTEAMVSLRDQPIDLLLLDMELPDMAGLDLLRLFPNHAPTIAISAFPQYAVDCYDSDIADFLTKPFTYSRFLRGLRRALFTALPADGPEAAREHVSVQKASPLPPSPPLSTHFYFKTGSTSERFVLSDILYLQAYNIYTKLITSTTTVVINDHISSLADELSPNNFLRVHKSYLVNLDQVTKFNARTIWLRNQEIPIGRTFKKDVQDRLKSLPGNA